ncbi:MAG: NAD(P)/FAD-dependent oxidoreductase [Ignavibacteriaceae bacterium]
MPTKHKNDFDVIIIGSGMGALSAASIFAQMKKKRVLVLERHFVIGGFTHMFKRKGKYEWDVGVHYIGGMAKGAMPRAVFDYITQGELEWNKMPDTYDVFVYPDITFNAKAGEENYKQELIKIFPLEQSAINKYFDDLKKVVNWAVRDFVGKTLSPKIDFITSILTLPGSELALMTTKEYLDKNFHDEKLKAILVSQWGDYGLPPSLSAFIIHATINSHYFSGAYYPVGGAKSIAKGIIPVVEKAGGELLINHTVDEIIIKNGKAVGVKVTHKKGNDLIAKEFYADIIISDAGAHNTYKKLIPESYHIPFRNEIDEFPPGTAHVSLYIGLNDDPRKYGFQGENYWIYDSYNHDSRFENRNKLLNGEVGGIYVSFPSIKDPEAKGHTMEILAFLDYEPFKKWAEQSWLKRDEEYTKLKKNISEALIKFLTQKLPALKDLIEYTELSTPLTTEHFTGHPAGGIYGLPATPERFKKKWLGIHTPIKNLYMVGADSLMLGLLPAMMSGALVYGVAEGMPLNLMRVFRTAMKYSKSIS